MDNTYGFTVNEGSIDESYIEVVSRNDGEYYTIGDGANQYAFTPDEWRAFSEKFTTIKKYFEMKG